MHSPKEKAGLSDWLAVAGAILGAFTAILDIHRGRGVELLRHGDERGVMGIQHIDDLREIGERPGKAVDLAPRASTTPTWRRAR